MIWIGVWVIDLLVVFDVDLCVIYVMQCSVGGYMINLFFEDFVWFENLLVYIFDGQLFVVEYGGLLWLVVLYLYFWKLVKWFIELEFMVVDVFGFWEKNGYYMCGDFF